ncbi:MAG: MerR family DNA-binding transcriptional regulator [Alphaproteobacteria bacterium]|nr:MerR family DNA-binding transcriptional regulator [Alphaproteobacteria bacterium]
MSTPRLDADNDRRGDERPGELYSTAELAEAAGVTARTVRFYETRGLLKPRRAGAIRVFSYVDRARLSLILRGKRLGFSLREIGDYLDLYGADRQQSGQLTYVVDKSRERIAELEGKMRDLQATIKELRKIEHDALKHLRTRRLKTARKSNSPPTSRLAPRET